MIVGVSLVKDEADIIEPILRHMADEVDELIVADNLSTDGTREILARLVAELPLTVIDDNEVAHYQGRKMTALAHLAGERGATWIVPFDADEWWCCQGRMKEILPSLTGVLHVPAFEHIPNDDDTPDSDPTKRIAHRLVHPKLMTKVAFEFRSGVRISEGNHAVIHPSPYAPSHPLEIREFQYRSLEQATRKVRNGKRALEATNLDPMTGFHWRQMGSWTDAEMAQWWRDYCSQEVIHDPCPR